MPQPSFTLGIEEEFQVIDPQTRELKSHIQELFAEGTIAFGYQTQNFGAQIGRRR